VTEARRAAIAHAAAEERFRLALDSATETIAMFRPVLDADGRLDDLEIVFANRVGRERWLGRARHEEVQGKRLYAGWPELRGRTYELYRRVVETGEPYAGPWSAPLDEGGRTYDLRIAAFPDGLVHTSMDVTDRVRAGEELQALADTLELRVAERTADLETFTRTASHDLRAPIRAIHGFATIVRRRYADHLDEEGRHYLDNIAQSSQAMADLLEDLLDYARLGSRAVRREPVELCSALEPALRGVRDQVRATRASIGVVEPLATMLADPTLVERILVNLVGNACTYHRPGVPPVVRIAARRMGDQVELSVADQGIGIPPDRHEAIFEVFTRLHSADEYPGTGIGLSIVRRAARLMGTDVTVDSEPGAGTTFRIRFPAA
jgi:signal transduction histidine kinase